MDPLSEVVKATVRTFRLYAKGHSNESHGRGTMQQAAYHTLLHHQSYQTPYELAELAEQLKVALRKTPLGDCKQDLAKVDIGLFMANEDVDKKLVLQRWRYTIAGVLAQLVRHRWPSLTKFYPHLF